MTSLASHSRRQFLAAGSVVGSGLLASACAGIAQTSATARAAESKPAAAEDVSPPEDLMREHGALNRILLIYDDCSQHLHAKKEFEIGVLASAATLVRTFVEDYHEKLEEDHLFPRFEKAGKHVDLVKVLREQHTAGRRLTERITQIAVPATMTDEDARKKLDRALRQFVRMYRPHEAREDTILFPALRDLMTAQEFDTMGDQFEEKENDLFGAHGFESIVEQIAALEKKLDIYELAQFTPAP